MEHPSNYAFCFAGLRAHKGTDNLPVNGRYLVAHQLPQERTLLRLDGQYGTAVVLSDLAGFAFVTRGKDYTVLDHPSVSARLHLPADQVQQRPESQMERTLYDCPNMPVGSEGMPCRVIVTTHPAGKKGAGPRQVVQSFGLGTRGMVYLEPMGLEPAPGGGTSAAA